MKRIFSIIIFSLILSGCASMIPDATEQEMTHHFEIGYRDSLSRPKDILFDKTITWIVTSFRSAKSVIDFQDKSLGLLKINAIGETNDITFKYIMVGKFFDNNIILDFSDLIPYINNEPYPSLSHARGLHQKAQGYFIKLTNEIRKNNL